jgi:hypothetical protein
LQNTARSTKSDEVEIVVARKVLDLPTQRLNKEKQGNGGAERDSKPNHWLERGPASVEFMLCHDAKDWVAQTDKRAAGIKVGKKAGNLLSDSGERCNTLKTSEKGVIKNQSRLFCLNQNLQDYRITEFLA